MTFRLPVSTLCGVVVATLGCSGQPAAAGNTAGAGGAASSAGSGGAAVGQAGMLGTAGTIQAGASGSSTGGAAAGASGSSAAAGGAGGATTQGGTSGATGASGASGASGAAGAAGQGGGGPGGKAGCADNAYDLCLDFETPIDTNVWVGGTQGAVITTDFAHGGHGYRLYPMSGGKLVAKKLGKITNQIWGRFYVHFKPGAPGGHGNILAAFDQSENWYEMGWQFDGMMGVWHSGNGERPLRSKPYIVDQWYCIETFFDGTKTEMPKWWIDGTEAQYYMSANEALIPKVVTQFARVEVGFTPYAGLGLMLPDQNVIKDDRVLTDMTIDDIAFNTTRIGCIAP